MKRYLNNLTYDRVYCEIWRHHHGDIEWILVENNPFTHDVALANDYVQLLRERERKAAENLSKTRQMPVEPDEYKLIVVTELAVEMRPGEK